MADHREQGSSPKNHAAHYRRVLAGRTAGVGAEGPLESTRSSGPDLSNAGIADRVATTRAELDRIVKQFLGDAPELHEIADQIARHGETALKAVANDDNAALSHPHTLNSLEVIVRADGSRPSFMVRNGEVDRATSPVGDWTATLDDSAALLRLAVQCIGRIDDPSGSQGFEGTGILIGENVVMTNRHVLQVIATRQSDKNWSFNPGIAVDFGHEFRARESVGRRKVTGVLFAGIKEIDPMTIDHAKLDLALLQLEPATEKPAFTLSLDSSPDWGQAQTGVFICGFPGNPGFTETPSLLETLFRSTYGCKRVAPGLVTTTAANMADSSRHWTLGHDATTLGGNSGSGVLVVGREKVTAGLHYGGRRNDPRENWCHVLGLALDEVDERSSTSLREILTQQGVSLVDPLSG
jgi:hypothetical protein